MKASSGGNMANINCDTKKIKNCGEDIITLSDDFNQLIDTLFKRIDSINKVDDGWHGEDADKYVTTVLKDKEIYTLFYNQLKEYGNTYIKAAEILDNTIKKDKYNNESVN